MHPRPLRRRSTLSRFALPLLAGVLALPLFAAPAYVTIGTGALNGVYYPTGGAICRLLNEDNSQHGLHCTVQSTSGSLANLADLAKGEVQLALVQSDVLYHAAHGTGPFAGKAPNETLRNLFRLHQESLTLLASATSNITTLADIEGKRVDIGAPNSGDRVTSQALLEAMGWQESSFTPPPVASPGNRLEGLCNGTLDAALLVAGHPNQGIGDLTGRCKARLIPIEGEQIDRLLKQHSYYQRSRIGANLYPGQTGGVNTFAVTAELVAEASLPEAEVRTVRDVLTNNLKQFTRLHPALTTLTPESMQADDIVPTHPGMQDAPPASTLVPDALAPSGAAATDSSAVSTGDAAAPSPEGSPATTNQEAAGATLPAASGATTTDPDAAKVLEGAAVGQDKPLSGASAVAAPSAATTTEPVAPAPSQPSGALPTQAPVAQ
ncbi:MAG: TAXI family TRAP transporter solute-binding subunit [Aeromonas sp.]|uniref:TAXI family TRAP transporter solute-binding subunit n=1 Tax=Aeromonas sp. TaxID=647 RepID=UPI002FCAAEED